MRRGAVVVLAVVAALAAMAATPSRVSGAAAAPPATLQLSARTVDGTPTRVVLTARLHDAGGAAMRGVPVEFAVAVPQFTTAPRLVLATATTDESGKATVADTPTFSGTLRYSARYAPHGATAVEAQATAEVAVAAAPAVPVADHPLAGAGSALIVGLAAVVCAVWILLIALLVHVFRALPRHAASSTRGPSALGG